MNETPLDLTGTSSANTTFRISKFDGSVMPIAFTGPVTMTTGAHLIGRDASLRSLLRAWWSGSRKL